MEITFDDGSRAFHRNTQLSYRFFMKITKHFGDNVAIAENIIWQILPSLGGALGSEATAKLSPEVFRQEASQDEVDHHFKSIRNVICANICFESMP